MSKENKPLAGALRAAHATPGGTDGESMDRKARVIESESGLRELVEAAERIVRRGTRRNSDHTALRFQRLEAALKRVKEG